MDNDGEIEKLEKKLRKVYLQAQADTQAKMEDYLQRFAAKDAIKREQVKQGKITQAQYLEWRKGQIAVGKQWQDKVDALAADYTNANKIAMGMVRNDMAGTFATNHNYAAYQLEHDTSLDLSFTLYDRYTLKNLVAEDPNLLPLPSVDIPKDLRWNKQKINSVITQAVLQGDSIPKIAQSLRKVTDMNHTAAVRNARTSMTAAQNAGRVESYKHAQDMGIEMEQEWLATLDGRTRHSHRQMDGERIPVAKDKWHPAKFSNGCRYPGDPQGPAWEIYNCRCTLVAAIKGIDQSDAPRNSKLGSMSYDEWKNAHKTTPVYTQDTHQGLGDEYTGPNGIVPFNQKLMEMDPSLFGGADTIDSNIRSEYNSKFRSVRYLHEQSPDEFPMVDYEEWLKMSFDGQNRSLPDFESYRKHCLEQEPWKYAGQGSIVDGFNRYNLGATPDGYGKGKGMRLVFDEEFGISKFIDTHPSIQYNGGAIYRGVKSSKSGINDLKKAMESGTPISMRGPSSWSTEEHVAVDFTKYSLRGTSKSLPVIFVEDGNFRRQAIPFPYSSTGFQPQFEVLYSGTSLFNITSMEEKEGVMYVHVKSK